MKILYGVQKPDEGTITVDGAAGLVRDAGRRDRRGHRHGLPALHAGRQPHRPRERRARRREAARHRRRRARGDRRDLRRLRLRPRPRRARRDARRRRAAARRDPQGPLPRRPHHHPRRADRRAGAAGGRRAVRQPARAQGAGPHRSSSSPTSSTRCRAIADEITVVRRGTTVGLGPTRRRHRAQAGRADGRQRAALAEHRGVDGHRPGAARGRTTSTSTTPPGRTELDRHLLRHPRRRGARHRRRRGQRPDRAGRER